MSGAYDNAIRIELANDIIALAEEYKTEKEYLDDFAEFGKAVQERLATFGVEFEEES